jgi:hypothetical protein
MEQAPSHYRCIPKASRAVSIQRRKIPFIAVLRKMHMPTTAEQKEYLGEDPRKFGGGHHKLGKSNFFNAESHAGI